jgi:hypothetical protein
VTEQRPDQGGLAHAVSAQETHGATAWYLQAHALEDVAAAVPRMDVSGLEDQFL